MKPLAWLSRAWLPVCFGLLALLCLDNLRWAARRTPGTGPYSPADPVTVRNLRCEPARLSLLARGVHGPIGYAATAAGEINTHAWNEAYFQTQYAMLPFVLDPAYANRDWVLAMDGGARAALANHFEPAEAFADGLTLWRRSQP